MSFVVSISNAFESIKPLHWTLRLYILVGFKSMAFIQYTGVKCIAFTFKKINHISLPEKKCIQQNGVHVHGTT